MARQSPSRHKLSAIEKEDDLNNDQIDELITRWHETRHTIRTLEEKEKHYKALIRKFMNVSDIDIVQGKDLEVQRTMQQRHIISKENLPTDIYDKYCQTRSIEIFYIRKRNTDKRNHKTI